MSQIHGKQVKDSSVLLNKIDPATGQLLTLVGTSKIQQPQAPTVGSDLANKDYVDSVASGLDTKEAVLLATTADLGGSYADGPGVPVGVGAVITGTGGPLSIDGVVMTNGDRILVKNQSNQEENGIYDVTSDGASWTLTRSTDFDGDPGNEVNGGEFTFVMDGTANGDTGWVVSAPSGVDATIGTTLIVWTQFSAAGVINAGAGLQQNGSNIDFQTGDTSLTIGATNAIVNVDDATIETAAGGIQVKDGGIAGTQLNVSVAGDGLAGGGGSALSVNVSNGLSIDADSVELGGTLNKNTTINGSNNDFIVNNTNNINLLSNADTIITASGNAALSATTQLTLASANLAINYSGNAIISDATNKFGLQYDSDYTGTFLDESLITKRYVDTQIGLIPSGDVTGVTAGAGISGGGTAGFLQLDVELTNNGGLTLSVAGDAGTIEVDYASLTTALAGNGLVQNGTTLDVNVGDGLVIVADTIETVLITNSGLSFSGGAIDLNIGTGLSISGGNVITDSSLSLLTADLANVNVATGSSIQTALEALDAVVGSVEVSENISVDLTPIASANFVGGVNAINAASLVSDSDGDAWVYLNGVQQVIGATTSAAWFWSADGGSTAKTTKTPLTGDQLYVNIDTLGFNVSGSNFDSDVVEVKYDSIA